MAVETILRVSRPTTHLGFLIAVLDDFESNVFARAKTNWKFKN